MYEFFIAQLVSGRSAEHSSTVSENKKLTTLAVCIPISIVHATPYVSTSSSHIWRVTVSPLLCTELPFINIFAAFALGT